MIYIILYLCILYKRAVTAEWKNELRKVNGNKLNNHFIKFEILPPFRTVTSVLIQTYKRF